MDPFDPATEAARLAETLRGISNTLVDPRPVIKTELPFYGVRVTDLRRTARVWHRAHADLSGSTILAVAEALWLRAIREEMVLATMIVGHSGDAVGAFGARRLDRWAHLLDNWEATDQLGGLVVGPWVAGDVDRRFGVLERLVPRRNPWLRRVALVGCVTVMRGENAARCWPGVSGIVTALAADREASIPKAISWVLRESTRHCAPQVERLLADPSAALPAIAVRETRNKLRTGYKSGRS